MQDIVVNTSKLKELIGKVYKSNPTDLVKDVAARLSIDDVPFEVHDANNHDIWHPSNKLKTRTELKMSCYGSGVIDLKKFLIEEEDLYVIWVLKNSKHEIIEFWWGTHGDLMASIWYQNNISTNYIANKIEFIKNNEELAMREQSHWHIDAAKMMKQGFLERLL